MMMMYWQQVERWQDRRRDGRRDGTRRLGRKRRRTPVLLQGTRVDTERPQTERALDAEPRVHAGARAEEPAEDVRMCAHELLLLLLFPLGRAERWRRARRGARATTTTTTTTTTGQ